MPHAGEDCRLNRIKVVQQALDGRVKRVYLEIGVGNGETLRRITADEKIAVHPAFKLSARTRRLADAKARATHYFETNSDTFFEYETGFLEQDGIDVALIDGFHTYRQVMREVENTLCYLRDDGVIVMHDCNPQTPRGTAPRRRTPTFVRNFPCKENRPRLRGGYR
jgi:Methyltransferase domain